MRGLESERSVVMRLPTAKIQSEGDDKVEVIVSVSCEERITSLSKILFTEFTSDCLVLVKFSWPLGLSTMRDWMPKLMAYIASSEEVTTVEPRLETKRLQRV